MKTDFVLSISQSVKQSAELSNQPISIPSLSLQFIGFDLNSRELYSLGTLPLHFGIDHLGSDY